MTPLPTVMMETLTTVMGAHQLVQLRMDILVRGRVPLPNQCELLVQFRTVLNVNLRVPRHVKLVKKDISLMMGVEFSQ